MRNQVFLALFGMLGMAIAPGVAMAGDDEEKTEKAEEEEPFDVIMVSTGSAPLDSIFKKSEGPIEIVATIRDDVRNINTKLVESLGLTQGTPFKDALTDLQTKAEDKINLSFEENKWPTLKASEGCPENVKASLNTLNTSLVDLNSAESKLQDAGKQLGVIAEEASDLAAEPKKLGLKATKVPKALNNSRKNVKSLKAGVDVTKELVGELKTMLSDIQSVFKESEEEEEEKAEE